MIRYKIDVIEDDAPSREGSVEDPDELEALLHPGGSFLNCCGYLYTDVLPDTSLCIAAVKSYGVSLGYRRNGTPAFRRLAIRDETRLSRMVDVWGEGGPEISQGLFLHPDLAWEGILRFVQDGGMYHKIRWVSPDVIPEDGNYLI